MIHLGTEVRKKWKTLRDRYVRQKKKLPSGSGKATKNDWPWATNLSFLGGGIEHRQ